MSDDTQNGGHDSGLTAFNFDDKELRVVMRDGEPWFVAKDVCDFLEIEKHRDAVSRLDVDERGSVKVDTPGGRQNVTAISESGFYTLTLRSRAATTEGTVQHRFRKWVTSEVLPAIRKDGSYRAQPDQSQAPTFTGPKSDLMQSHILLNAVLTHQLKVEPDRAAAHLISVAERRIDPSLGDHRALIPHRTGGVAVDTGTMRATELAAAVNAAIGGPAFAHKNGKPSPKAVNTYMEEMGWQESRERARGGKYWALTDLGAQYGEAVIADFNGSNTAEIQWRPSAVAAIVNALHGGES